MYPTPFARRTGAFPAVFEEHHTESSVALVFNNAGLDVSSAKVSGVTKNAIDWASRPPKNAPLKQKPVGILGASPGMTGSARGQSQLRQAFEFTNSYCMPQPEILVYKAHQKFDDEGRLTDEKTREFLAKYLEALYNWVNTFKE